MDNNQGLVERVTIKTISVSVFRFVMTTA